MSDLAMTYQEYYAEIRAIVGYVQEAAEDQDGQLDLDNELDNVVSSHEFVIYTAKSLAVLVHSQNWLDYEANFGDPSEFNSLLDMLPQYALSAIRADVHDTNEWGDLVRVQEEREDW